MTTDTSSIAKKPMRNWNNTALIVVDVQNDFCPGGALAVKDGDQVVEPINAILEEARSSCAVIAFTQDAHPENTKHFKRWPKHCIVGTPGYDFHPNLKYSAEDEIIEKGMGSIDDGYSAFEGYTRDGVAFKNWLECNYIKKLVVVGLATDYCVSATALDGVVNGFDVTVILSATRAVNLNPNDEADAVCEMYNLGVEIEP